MIWSWHVYIIYMLCLFHVDLRCHVLYIRRKSLGLQNCLIYKHNWDFSKLKPTWAFFTAFTSSPRFGPLHCILLNWLLINSLFWIQESQGKDTKHTVQKNNNTGKSKHTDDFLLFWGPLNIESEPYTWRMSNDFVQVYNMVIWLGPTWYVLSSLAHSHDYDYNQNQSHILIIPWPL